MTSQNYRGVTLLLRKFSSVCVLWLQTVTPFSFLRTKRKRKRLFPRASKLALYVHMFVHKTPTFHSYFQSFKERIAIKHAHLKRDSSWQKKMSSEKCCFCFELKMGVRTLGIVLVILSAFSVVAGVIAVNEVTRFKISLIFFGAELKMGNNLKRKEKQVNLLLLQY